MTDSRDTSSGWTSTSRPSRRGHALEIAAEEAVGIGAAPGSKPRDLTPLRLHPDDIAAIVDRLAHVLAPKEQP